MDLENRPPYRQEQLRRLMRMRRAAEHLATAQFLESRAERVGSPVLASLLRERAGVRRSRGERLLAGPLGARPEPPRRLGTVTSVGGPASCDVTGPHTGEEAAHVRRR